MAYRRTAFTPGEWYHCYTRGVDGRVTFETRADYQRFLQALYIANSTSTLDRANFPKLAHEKVFELPRNKPLVAVGAYCLMPNHFHLLLQERVEGGITMFMRRVGTSYAMYFNTKNKRAGNLFIKPFRSKHIEDDAYLKRIIEYIHLNPAEIIEKTFKDGDVQNMKKLELFVRNYFYSSAQHYFDATRPEGRILDQALITELLSEKMPPLKELLRERAAYYADLKW